MTDRKIKRQADKIRKASRKAAIIEIILLLLAILCILLFLNRDNLKFPAFLSSDTRQTLSQDEDTVSSDSLTEDAEDPDNSSYEASDSSSDTPVEENLPDTVTISSVGDCSLGKLQIHSTVDSFLDYYDSYGSDYFMKNVKDYFLADDLTIANLEVVLSNTEAAGQDKEFLIKGRPEFTSILKDAGIDVVGTGNNHILDYGETGANDTWQALNDAGIPYAYNDKTVLYTTANGHKVGIAASCLLNESRMQFLLNGIQELKAEGAELIIVMPHWGVERENYANERQVTLAHQLIDAGADLILGSHPHVVQGFEIYNGKMIAYSQGNFCYGGHHNPADKDSFIYQQTFTFTDGALDPTVDVHIVPCLISSTTSKNDFCPTPQTGEAAETILNHLNSYSAGYSDFSLDTEGNFYR